MVDLMIKFKPFLHKHYLLYDNYQNQQACCAKCNKRIQGWAFTCEICNNFWLHQICAQDMLPPQIPHPLHPEKYLHLKTNRHGNNDFICGKCFTLSRGFRYVDDDDRGQDSSLELDVMCAFSTTDHQTLIREDMGKRIRHFCHDEPLTLFTHRKVSKNEYWCRWCEKPLSGMCYGCVSCNPTFCLHQSCLYTIPHKILQHHFHPSHTLYINCEKYNLCAVCTRIITDPYCFSCHKCYFHVHVLCTKLKPTLKHECHSKHYLTYIENTRGDVFYIDKSWYLYCKKCQTLPDRNSTLYRCVQCYCSFHFECLIPSTIRHEYHTHDLVVMTSFKEDHSGEYCDICEEQRSPNHHVYCCTECKFIAHIECALGKVNTFSFFFFEGR